MTLFSEIQDQFSDKDGKSPFFYRRAFRGEGATANFRVILN